MTFVPAKYIKEAVALTAALDTPDSNVPVPRVTKPGSFLSMVKGLDVGENASKSVLANTDQRVEEFTLLATADRTRLRNNMQSTMNAAVKGNDMKFECEIVTAITPQNRIYHIAIITRTN